MVGAVLDLGLVEDAYIIVVHVWCIPLVFIDWTIEWVVEWQ